MTQFELSNRIDTILDSEDANSNFHMDMIDLDVDYQLLDLDLDVDIDNLIIEEREVREQLEEGRDDR